jgi:hydrogenase maturation protease
MRGGLTVVIGIGNTLLSDDGVGVHVVDRLREQATDPAIAFLDGGTLSFTLAVPIAEADNLLVVDAAELKSEPGSVRLFEGDAMDVYLNSGARRSVHEVGLIDLMTVARLSERLPARRALIGIQPASTDWGERPTAAVADAIPRACEMATALLERWAL